MRKRGIMFLDQIVDAESDLLYSWDYIKVITGTSQKGPIPTWFKEIEKKITFGGSRIAINGNERISWLPNNHKISEDISTDKRKKNGVML